MYDLVLFGGTTEGRQLAAFCHEHQIPALVSVASDYGKQVLLESPFLTVREEALDSEQMTGLFISEGVKLVLDATHPYAVEVTKNIKRACQMAGVEYVRVIRGLGMTDQARERYDGDIVWVDSLALAVAYLKGTEGAVFVTTGSKELKEFMALNSYQERVYARVLPSGKVLSECEEAGIRGKHLIGMQGPFSVEMNCAMLRDTKATYLVTKEAGAAGGFQDKLEAAAKCGVRTIVIGRPEEEPGLPLQAAEEFLLSWKNRERSREPGHITLVGTGMGGAGQMTIEAVEALKRCDAVLGASRVLESAKAWISGAYCEEKYLGSDIITWLETQKKYKNIGILYSGDTGFYSGARQLMDLLSKMNGYETRIIPGISSVSYLCARLGTTWEDARLVSLHGRTCRIEEEVREYKKVFTLLGGENSVSNLCERLIEAGLCDAVLSVGENLSYPEERIRTGTPIELKKQTFSTLASVLINLQR